MTRLAVALAVVVASLRGALALPVLPAGGEFQVNSYTTGDQGDYFRRSQSVCRDASGRFVVAWQSQDQDGSSNGIFAQRYDSGGTKQGTEFQVNVTTSSGQHLPDVACEADGDFVAVWEGYGGSTDGIHGRRFDSTGAPKGGEFLVAAGSYDQFGGGPASVASSALGNFVVVWGGSGGTMARRFGSDGTPLGGAFVVSTGDTYSPEFADVAAASDGRFVVVWQSDDGDAAGIAGRRFSSAGAAEGTEFQVNTFTTGRQYRPSVTMNAGGAFVIAWQGYYNSRIVARRYDVSGAPQSGELRVTEDTEYDLDANHPSAGMTDAGDFVVVWTQQLSAYDVFGRTFAADGTPDGDPFVVNTGTDQYELYGEVAVGANGDFVVVWTGGQSRDGGGYGVFAQRYDAAAPSACPNVGAPEVPLSLARTTLTFAGATSKFTLRGTFTSAPGFDPATVDTMYLGLSTDAGALWSSGPIAPGTAQWAKSNPAKRRFTWKDPTGTVVPGLTALTIKERPAGSGNYVVNAKGKNAAFASASPSAGTHGATLEFSAAPLCLVGKTTTCSKRPPRERCN